MFRCKRSLTILAGTFTIVLLLHIIQSVTLTSYGYGFPSRVICKQRNKLQLITLSIRNKLPYNHPENKQKHLF